MGTAGLAALLFGLFEAAEGQAGAAGGFDWRQAPCYVLCNFVFVGGAEIFVECGLYGFSVEEGTEAEAKVVKHFGSPALRQRGTLFVPQGDHGIDADGAAGWNVRRQDSYCGQQDGYEDECGGVAGADSVEEMGEAG